jgi:hypothetical protein
MFTIRGQPAGVLRLTGRLRARDREQKVKLASGSLLTVDNQIVSYRLGAFKRSSTRGIAFPMFGICACSRREEGRGGGASVTILCGTDAFVSDEKDRTAHRDDHAGRRGR